jgi:two-component system, NtrC family, sensor kinase
LKKPKSLRTILTLWFILFSIGPLVFLGVYSIFQFEQALTSETIVRLEGNGREVENILNDYSNLLQQSRNSFLSDVGILFYLTMLDEQKLIEESTAFLNKGILTSASFYDTTGRLITTVFRDERNSIRTLGQTSEKILLNEKYLSNLKQRNEIGFIDNTNNKFSLILFSKVLSSKNKHVGYFEQIVSLNDSFLMKLKNKFKVELFVVSEGRKVVLATRPELKHINLSGTIYPQSSDNKFFDYEIKNQNYGFIFYPLSWDRSSFYLGIGTIKQDSQNLLRNLRITFLTTVTLTSLFLLLTIYISINMLFKPVNQLIEGLKAFDSSDQLVQVSTSSQTEIGLLASAFNDMSYRIYKTRDDLKKKIKELENSNRELKEAQSKLVHSAKMTSLGQLVAGVAHELNNPIGFIFSNTKHLKDYSEKLIEMIHYAETDLVKFKEKKLEFDFDFIKNDLPKLIKSCEDGAQRTRDIVLGLRNFSRLEEAQLKEIDVRDALDTTLELLKGEIKNRIQVHRQYEPVPKIQCYASQINQVFMNILSNAVQAIKGTGTIWITTLPLRPGGDQIGRVQISIQDSGEGIESEFMEKIFEPFFTTKGIGQGTGLGLSISYGIIQNHGGEIQVRSQKGVGTEFVIIIPVELGK